MICHESFIFRTFANKILFSIIINFVPCCKYVRPLKPNFQYEIQNESANSSTQMDLLNRCMLEMADLTRSSFKKLFSRKNLTFGDTFYLSFQPQHRTQYSPLRMLLLVSLSFCFGIEVGYKFATKQLVWLLNPCHVTSLVCFIASTCD